MRALKNLFLWLFLVSWFSSANAIDSTSITPSNTLTPGVSRTFVLYQSTEQNKVAGGMDPAGAAYPTLLLQPNPTNLSCPTNTTPQLQLNFIESSYQPPIRLASQVLLRGFLIAVPNNYMVVINEASLLNYNFSNSKTYYGSISFNWVIYCIPN